MNNIKLVTDEIKTFVANYFRHEGVNPNITTNHHFDVFKNRYSNLIKEILIMYSIPPDSFNWERYAFYYIHEFRTQREKDPPPYSPKWDGTPQIIPKGFKQINR